MKNLLKEFGLKSTKQRELVLSSINELGVESTINNILKKCIDIDKSTIYRTLDILEEKGIIVKSLNFDNKVIYQVHENHKHHFTCIKCHQQINIDVCPLEDFEKDLEEKKGYKIINHIVELKGICNKCSKKK